MMSVFDSYVPECHFGGFILGHFYIGFTARQDYFTPFEPNQSLGGAKARDLREKTT